ncbi:MAG: esterase family protein [Streptococcaceae bacterium]|jgi:putative tributyrin esterase|nr:esterase family protein [Streptococcaceae bacterium]
MALMEITYFSDSLDMEQKMTVLLPETRQTDIPVLYLLHGMGGSHSSWLRKSIIERLIKDLNLALVMPSTDLAYYTNTTYGMNYFDAIALELPEKIHQYFSQLSTKKQKNFICGFSMGGYGALKIGLKTDKFGYIASLSGAFDIKNETLNAMKDENYWQGIFGDLDPFEELVNVAKTKKNQPQIYAWCGKQDFLFKANEQMMAKLEAFNYPLTFEITEGSHEWYYWDKYLENVLSWLPVNYTPEERLS